MSMKDNFNGKDPDGYVASLTGWQNDLVTQLRAAALSTDGIVEVIKYGHLVYLAQGPVLLVRAEANRVLLGFWRGQRLQDMEPRLRSGGQYEMATISFTEGETIDTDVVVRLTQAAVALNIQLGDPTKAARNRSEDHA